MDYFNKNITVWSDTSIRDDKVIDFINNIKAIRLKRIIREHFEHKCYFTNYTLDDFREEFKKYLEDKDDMYRFLPGLDSKYENILKMLLEIK